MHEEVNTLVVSAAVGSQFRIEGSLAVNHPQVVGYKREVQTFDKLHILGDRHVVAEAQLLQAQIGSAVVIL